MSFLPQKTQLKKQAFPSEARAGVPLYEAEKLDYKGLLKRKSFRIEEGQRTCIVGRTGSGKTTILRLLNKLLSPSEGSLLFRGCPLHSLSSTTLRQHVLLLPQEPWLFGSTVEEHVQAVFRFNQKAESYKSDELLDGLLRFNLTADRSLSTKTFSGGERQRLALLSLCLLKPKVLLLDEPTSALDSATANAIMKEVLDRVPSLILVSHDEALVQNVADQVIEMER